MLYFSSGKIRNESRRLLARGQSVPIPSHAVPSSPQVSIPLKRKTWKYTWRCWQRLRIDLARVGFQQRDPWKIYPNNNALPVVSCQEDQEDPSQRETCLLLFRSVNDDILDLAALRVKYEAVVVVVVVFFRFKLENGFPLAPV